ncbi:hypothetical protein JCM10213_008105 [Rhodosporidiobolus nylandii]
MAGQEYAQDGHTGDMNGIAATAGPPTALRELQDGRLTSDVVGARNGQEPAHLDDTTPSSSTSVPSHSLTPLERRTPFSVVHVGAGEINFGTTEGPWNHSLRLERIFGENLMILGIIDPLVDRAREQLDRKIAAGVPGYASAATWATPDEAAAALGPEATVDLVIVGAPPHIRGTTSAPADLDLRLLKALPRTRHWLVEKPVSAAPPSELAGQRQVLQAYGESGAVVGVGYFAASLGAVAMMKRILAEKRLTVMGTSARYYMAYEWARKPAWWDWKLSCGPVVEQATHLVNLSLLFGGPANLSSVRTHTVEHSDAPGKLSKIGFDEEGAIAPEARIPRYTSSIWTYEGGAVGTLTHAVALHGTTYQTELEVVTDGTTFKLYDIYTSSPKLSVYHSDQSSTPELHTFDNDDAFETQVRALVAGKPNCTFEQALQTYELTWAIRQAGERELAARRETPK